MANWLALAGAKSLVAVGSLAAVAVAGVGTVVLHRDKLPLLLNRIGISASQAPEKAEKYPVDAPSPEPLAPVASSPDKAVPIAPSDNTEIVADVEADVADEERADEDGARGTPIVPGFDLLRVEKDAALMVVGTAEPGSRVELLNADGSVLGRAIVEPEGDFAILSESKLPPGDHSFFLRSTMGTDSPVKSAQSDMVHVPMVADPAVAMVSQDDQPAVTTGKSPVARSSQDSTERAPALPDQTVRKEPTLPQAPVQTPVLPKALSERKATGDSEAGASQSSVELPPDAGPVTPADPVPSSVGKQEFVPSNQSEAEANQTLSGPQVIVEAVEIEEGQIYIAGAVKQGVPVRVYIDDQIIDTVRGTKDNRFLASKRFQLTEGLHSVRADVIDPKDGRVLSRAEVPVIHDIPKALEQQSTDVAAAKDVEAAKVPLPTIAGIESLQQPDAVAKVTDKEERETTEIDQADSSPKSEVVALVETEQKLETVAAAKASEAIDKRTTEDKPVPTVEVDAVSNTRGSSESGKLPNPPIVAAVEKAPESSDVLQVAQTPKSAEVKKIPKPSEPGKTADVEQPVEVADVGEVRKTDGEGVAAQVSEPVAAPEISNPSETADVVAGMLSPEKVNEPEAGTAVADPGDVVSPVMKSPALPAAAIQAKEVLQTSDEIAKAKVSEPSSQDTVGSEPAEILEIGKGADPVELIEANKLPKPETMAGSNKVIAQARATDPIEPPAPAASPGLEHDTKIAKVPVSVDSSKTEEAFDPVKPTTVVNAPQTIEASRSPEGISSANSAEAPKTSKLEARSEGAQAPQVAAVKGAQKDLGSTGKQVRAFADSTASAPELIETPAAAQVPQPAEIAEASQNQEPDTRTDSGNAVENLTAIETAAPVESATGSKTESMAAAKKVSEPEQVLSVANAPEPSQKPNADQAAPDGTIQGAIETVEVAREPKPNKTAEISELQRTTSVAAIAEAPNTRELVKGKPAAQPAEKGVEEPQAKPVETAEIAKNPAHARIAAVKKPVNPAKAPAAKKAPEPKKEPKPAQVEQVVKAPDPVQAVEVATASNPNKAIKTPDKEQAVSAVAIAKAPSTIGLRKTKKESQPAGGDRMADTPPPTESLAAEQSAIPVETVENAKVGTSSKTAEVQKAPEAVEAAPVLEIEQPTKPGATSKAEVSSDAVAENDVPEPVEAVEIKKALEPPNQKKVAKRLEPAELIKALKLSKPVGRVDSAQAPERVAIQQAAEDLPKPGELAKPGDPAVAVAIGPSTERPQATVPDETEKVQRATRPILKDTAPDVVEAPKPPLAQSFPQTIRSAKITKTPKSASAAKVTVSSKPSQLEVLSTAENPVTPVAPSVIKTGTALIVKRGDSLWRISRKAYGRGIRFRTIFNANRDQIRDPHWIYVGQIFRIPEKAEQ